MTNSVLVFLFWCFFAAVFYTYFGYPALLFAISRIGKKQVKKKPYKPSVSVVISAFNEEAWIEQKLLNLLELSYPAEKLEILIGSDGASDRTDEIVSKFRSTRIRFFRFVENFGKPHVLNALVREACGEIIMFTDSRQELERGAIRALAANFADQEVGCASGELCFKISSADSAGTVGEGMDTYWRYEKFLRKCESEIGSMLGATGAIYAIRKSLFPEHLPADILVDDMYIPLTIISKGYRAIFELEARAYDRVSEHGTEEFTRKVRTLAGNYQIFTYFPELFVPFKSPIAWQLFSHKFLRLVVPFFLLGIFFLNLFMLQNPFYFLCFILQIFFYGSAAYEARQTKSGRTKRGIGCLPYTFCLLNYSALMALVRFLQGSQRGAWKKAYA